MRMMKWVLDPTTLYWAGRAPIPFPSKPDPQFEADPKRFNPASWKKHILKRDFSSDVLRSDGSGLDPRPRRIIRSLKKRDVLQALVLTVIWGTMTRTKPRIYTKSLEEIEALLLKTMEMMERERTAQEAWGRLAGGLGWSPVICSKFLHFAARSLGFEFNPPVPIDNEVIVNKVWPVFRGSVGRIMTEHDPPAPKPWLLSGASWAGYSRYMTAISVWAALQGWTTTQLENTLYARYS